MPQVQVNGANIYYEEAGTGTPLLLLHGLLETGGSHAHLMQTLARHYRVIAPDLRGYGRSGPEPRTFPPDVYERDTADMAALLDHLGIAQAVVMGVADGAEIALLLPIRHPELVRAVVAVSVTGALHPSLLDVLPTLDTWDTAPAPDDTSPRADAIREYGLDGARAIWRGWAGAVRDRIAAGGNISMAEAGRITCPVLIINGADDTLNTPAMSHALAQAIPNAELHLVADVDQQIYNKRRQWLADFVLTWLAAH
ncbi:MAG TPA: alpha/beta fold hydrolase [Chloroflexia bacterium]